MSLSKDEARRVLGHRRSPRAPVGLAILSTMVTVMFVGAVMPAKADAASGRGPVAREQRVSYRDLDLTETGGVHTLDRRVRAAARDVCATVRDPMALAALVACRRSTLAATRPQIDRAVSRAREAAFANGQGVNEARP